MKKGILFCLLIVASVIFVACGDDSSSPNNANPAQGNILPEESEKVEASSSSSVKAISVSSSGRKEDSPVVYPVITGTLIDERDSQIYKTVTIGSQTWMAQNLNYETDDSYCYNDKPAYCSKYGRLYTWAAAMDSAATWSANGKGCGVEGLECFPTDPVRGVCPKGWHLPNNAEWDALLSFVGFSAYYELETVFIQLKLLSLHPHLIGTMMTRNASARMSSRSRHCLLASWSSGITPIGCPPFGVLCRWVTMMRMAWTSEAVMRT